MAILAEVSKIYRKMKPQDYINILQSGIDQFDNLAENAIRDVGIDFFTGKYEESFDKSETIKGKSFDGAPFSVKNFDYVDVWKPGHRYFQLNISNKGNEQNSPNPHSFRKSMYFEGNGLELHMANDASWKGEEYGSDVIANMFHNGIDVLEFENKNDQDKEMFLRNLIQQLFQDF